MATGSATAATSSPEREPPDEPSDAASSRRGERSPVVQGGMDRVRAAVAVATLTVTEVGLLYLFAYFVVEILL